MKKNFKLFKIGIFLALILGFALGQDAYGASYTSSGSGNWTTVVNAATTAADDITIAAGHAVVLDASSACRSITIEAGAKLNAVADGGQTLTIYGDVTMASATSLIGDLFSPNIIFAADATVTSGADGDMIWEDITVNDTCDVEFVAATAGHDINIEGGVTVSGTGTIAQNATALDWVFNAGAAQAISVSSTGEFTVADLLINTASTVVTLNGTMTAASVTFGNDATLDAADGTDDILTVLGDITLTGSTAVVGGGTPLDLVIGDATLATSITSSIASAVTDDMTWANVTLYNAAVDVSAAGAELDMNIQGDLTLAGASTLTDGGTDMEVVFNGATVQTITVSDDSFLSFSDLTIENAATDVRTADDITIEVLTMTDGGFTQTAGTTYITAEPVYTAATIGVQFNNLSVNTNAAGNAWPIPMTIIGDFTKFGTNTLTITNVATTMDNTSEKEMVFSGGTVKFHDLTLAANSRVTTNSSFTLGDGTNAGTMTVNSGASFNAGTGTITADLTAANYTLDNSGGVDSCLTVSSLVTSGGANILLAPTDMVITGDLDVQAGTLQGHDAAGPPATAGGTIKFENTVQRSITNAGTLAFYALEIADGSSVVITDDDAVIIRNNGYTGGQPGITVGTGATLDCGDGTASVTFGGANEGAKAATIVNNGTLTFNDVVVTDNNNCDVTTSSSFTIAGDLTVASTTNGSLVASTPSVITFTGATPTVTGGDAATDLVLFDLVSTSSDITHANSTFMTINGDITCNGTGAGSFIAGGNAASLTLSGSALQILGGSTDVSNPYSFGVLIINNSSDGVSLGRDAVVQANGTLTLTDGVLDLNSQTFTNGAGTIGFTAGVGYIDGATGTYVLSTSHEDDKLENDMFSSTLYNLTVSADHSIAGNLDVLGDLQLNDQLDIDDGAANGFTLTVYGNIAQTLAADDYIGFATARADEAKLVLTGSGTVCPLSNDLFGGTSAPTIEVKRATSLSADLDITGQTANKQATLIINSGTQNLGLETYTLTFEGDVATPDFAKLSIVSGTMDADSATVVLNDGFTELPANCFLNDEVDDLTIATDITLLGNLKVNTALQGVFDITTGDNYLELASGATDPFTDAAHVIGKLRRTVTGSTETTFEIGDGTAVTYRPVEILFATAATSQVVEVSSVLTSPVADRAGDPSKCINSVWTINPIGTVTNTFDSLQVNFGWGLGVDNGGISAVNNETFSARWNGSNWDDYRDAHVTGAGAVGTPAANDGITMTTYDAYPLSSTDFGGTWAVFDAASNSNTDKDAAIALATNKLVFTTQPTTAEDGIPFNATIQLQDQYGNPVTTTNALTLSITEVETPASLTGDPVSAVIPAGGNAVTVNGLILNTANTEDVQIRASATYPAGGSTTIYGTSDPIDILQTQPAVQGSMLTLSNVDYTSMTVTFTGTGTASDKAVIVAKAGSAVDSDDYPVDGASYIGNNVFGAGSIIGDGVVVYNGVASAAGTYSFTLSGLAPGTTYYLRVFTYQGANGTENYNTNPGPLSFRSATTTTETDDDVAFGSNDTRATAKPIGANSAVSGTIADATDEDWFSFMVTSAASNVRVKLTGVPANYNLELYNADNRRVRRATLSGTESEYVVINNLDAGTYSIRIYGVDGANDSDPYTVEVQTRDTEIFSVTQ